VTIASGPFAADKVAPIRLAAYRGGRVSDSPLRILGICCGAAVIALALGRRARLRNGDVIVLLLVGAALLVVSGTTVADGILRFFSFSRGDDRGRIIGVCVFAIVVLFGLYLRAMAANARADRQLSALVEGLAADEFASSGLGERFADRVAVLIPAYEEEEALGNVLAQIPERVCGVLTATLVVDDGSRDRTGAVARAHGAAVVRHVANRGGGAALRTGYRVLAEAGARVVVTLDGDGQHLPAEMERLVEPVLSGRVDLAHGSRVLGHAAPNHFSRELGIAFFNRVVSLLTRTRVTDCSNGFRAVRASVLARLVLRQEQFHSSEFVIEAIKRGVPAIEVPVTVVARTHGRSKKPPVVRYGLGFATAILRAWLR
jgi:glycosyl transferase family 2